MDEFTSSLIYNLLNIDKNRRNQRVSQTEHFRSLPKKYKHEQCSGRSHETLNQSEQFVVAVVVVIVVVVERVGVRFVRLFVSSLVDWCRFVGIVAPRSLSKCRRKNGYDPSRIVIRPTNHNPNCTKPTRTLRWTTTTAPVPKCPRPKRCRGSRGFAVYAVTTSSARYNFTSQFFIDSFNKLLG